MTVPLLFLCSALDTVYIEHIGKNPPSKNIASAYLYSDGIACYLLWNSNNVINKPCDWEKEEYFLQEAVCHMSKAEQMKSLKTGNGIQYLLDEGYKILGNPINTFDTDYKLIAYTDVSVDDRFWNELVTTGTFSIDAQIFFMNECFTDDVANAKKLALMKSDKLKYDRILGHIYNGNGMKVANVLMFEYSCPFDSDMIAAFEILADLLTSEISNDKSFITYGEAWQNAMINRLIDCDLEEKGLYSPHVQNLYDGFKTNIYMAVVDITRSEAQHNGLKYFVDLFRQKQKNFKYAVYENYVIIIMSTDYETFNIKREAKDLAEYIERENLLIGISNGFDNLFELRKHYIEAVQALSKKPPNRP